MDNFNRPNSRDYGYDAQREKIARMSKEGYRQLKANKLSFAKELFSQILTIDDKNNYALVGLGDCERKLCNFEEAVPLYLRCLDVYPDNNYALFGLADCYRSMGKYKEGAEVWERYLKYDTNNITVLTRVADTYRKLRDYNKSKSFYMRVLDLDPNNSYALIGLGHLNYDYHYYDEALKYWVSMLKLQGDNVDIRVLTSIGNCYRKIRDFGEGYKYFQKAISMEANNFYALFGIADCLRGLGRSDEAIKYWETILRRDSNNKTILTRVGDAYRKKGDLASAEEYYNRALDVEFDTYAAMGLAFICKDKGNYEEAIKRFEHLTQTDAENYRPYVELSNCYIDRGQKAEAIKTLEAFSKQGTFNETVMQMLSSLRDGGRGVVPVPYTAGYIAQKAAASDKTFVRDVSGAQSAPQVSSGGGEGDDAFSKIPVEGDWNSL